MGMVGWCGFFGILTLAILMGKHCEEAWSMVNSLPWPWHAPACLESHGKAEEMT